MAAEGQKKKKPATIQPIPGMIVNVEKKKKKKKTGIYLNASMSDADMLFQCSFVCSTAEN